MRRRVVKKSSPITLLLRCILACLLIVPYLIYGTFKYLLEILCNVEDSQVIRWSIVGLLLVSLTIGGSIALISHISFDTPPIHQDYSPSAPIVLSDDIQLPNDQIDTIDDILSSYDITWALGEDEIATRFGVLTRVKLPIDFGDRTDCDSFKPLESYTKITNVNTSSYKITHDEEAYTDKNGFRRFYTHGMREFTIVYGVDDKSGDVFGYDDYLVAMGTYYKGTTNTVGQRFLVVGENGIYTIRVGDEKQDCHTDEKNMYSFHGKKGGLLEFIIDSKSPSSTTMMYHGNANYGSSERIKGKILMMYRID